MNLGSATLTGAHLTGANLTGANLGSATLYAADLTRANLIGANLIGAKWPKNTPAPEGWVRDPGTGQLTPANAGHKNSSSKTASEIGRAHV